MIGAQRGETVVCIPVHGGHEHFVACLDSVLAHTSAGVPILICDDASPDRRSQEHVGQIAREASAEHELLYMRHAVNVGFPATANAAFASAAPADVVLLNSDCVVAHGWLEGLREAAYVDQAVATATALTNHGTIVSVPERGVSTPTLPEGWSIEAAAAAVRSRSLRLRPRLLTAVGHCVYLRRSALELVSGFDLAFSPGYGEEVDFSQRCLAAGLLHVAADDVLVLHHGGGSFSTEGVVSPTQAEHEQLLATRYPYYHDAVRAGERDLTGPLPRALGAARRALTGLSVVIDPRAGGGEPDRDTDRQASGLIAALRQIDGVRVTVASGASPGSESRADVVHRLFGVSDLSELASVAAWGDRLILTHRDLLAYHNPGRFGSFAAWERHRGLTRAALGAADHVVFPTAHARSEALAEDLVAADRTSVVALGEGNSGAAPAAERLRDVYHAARDAPPRAVRVVPEQREPPAPHPMSEDGLRLVSEDGLRLVGPGGALPAELERPLLALVTHPQVARPVLGAIKAGYRAGYWLRRRGR